MFESRAEIVAWVVAVVGVACMGLLVAHGPFHNINKQTVVAASTLPPIQVKIVTDPKTTARYVPSPVTVHVGQEVIFTNVSTAPHTVSADNSSFDSGDIPTGSSHWTYKPVKTGTFKYFCQYHPLMHGVLIVK